MQNEGSRIQEQEKVSVWSGWSGSMGRLSYCDSPRALCGKPDRLAQDVGIHLEKQAHMK